MKLYFVELRGMRGDFGTGPNYGESYVVAENETEAYQKVRKFLDKEKLDLIAIEIYIV